MTVDLSKVAVVSSPWRWYKQKGRFFNAISDIRRDGFREIASQQKAFFIPELNMLFVTSGQHHISVAALRKAGKMHAEVHLMRDILRRYTGSAVGLWDKGAQRGRGVLIEGVDPRLCLLLEIYREKYHLQNKLAVQQKEKDKNG